MVFTFDALGDHIELFYLSKLGWTEVNRCNVIPLESVLRIRILKRAFKIGQFVNIKSGKISLVPVDGSMGSLTTSAHIDDFGNHIGHFSLAVALFSQSKVYQLELNGFDGFNIDTFSPEMTLSNIKLTHYLLKIGPPQILDTSGSLTVTPARTERDNLLTFISALAIDNKLSGIISIITQFENPILPNHIQETSVKEINPLNHPVPRTFEYAGLSGYTAHIYQFDGTVISRKIASSTNKYSLAVVHELESTITSYYCADPENDFIMMNITGSYNSDEVLEFVHEADHSLLLENVVVTSGITMTGTIRTEAERGRYRLRTTMSTGEIGYSNKFVILRNDSGVTRPTSSDIFVGSMTSDDDPVVSGSQLVIRTTPQYNGGYTSNAPMRKDMLSGILVLKPDNMLSQSGIRFPFIRNTITGDYEAFVEMGDQLYDQHLCSADIVAFIRDEDICGNKFWRLIHNAVIHYSDISPPIFLAEPSLYLLDCAQRNHLCSCRDQKVAIAADCIEDCSGLADVKIAVQYNLNGECLESTPVAMQYVDGMGTDCEDLLIGSRYMANLDLSYLAYTTSCNANLCKYTFIIYLYSQSGEIVSSVITGSLYISSCFPPTLFNMNTGLIEIKLDQHAVNISTLPVEGFSALHFFKHTCICPEIRLNYSAVTDYYDDSKDECKECMTPNDELNVFCRIEGLNVIYDNPIQPFWKVMKLHRMGFDIVSWYWAAEFDVNDFYQPNDDESGGQEQPRYGVRFRFLDCASNNITSDVITKLVNVPYFEDLNQTEGADQNSLGGFWIANDSTCPELRDCCFDAFWISVDGAVVKQTTCDLSFDSMKCELQEKECEQSHICSGFGVHIPGDLFMDDESGICETKFQICLKELNNKTAVEQCLAICPENMHSNIDLKKPIPCEATCEYSEHVRQLNYGTAEAVTTGQSRLNFVYVSGAGQKYNDLDNALAGINLYAVNVIPPMIDLLGNLIIENSKYDGVRILGGNYIDNAISNLFIRNYGRFGLNIDEGTELNINNMTPYSMISAYISIDPDSSAIPISVKQSRNNTDYIIQSTNVLAPGLYSSNISNSLVTDGSTLSIVTQVAIPSDPFTCVMNPCKKPNITVECSIINKNTTWSGVVQINGEVIVKSLNNTVVTLTISAGTEIRFAHVNETYGRRPAALIIDKTARLTAIGTSTSPICFIPTPIRGVIPHESGLWGGIVIIGNSTAYTGQPNVANTPVNQLIDFFQPWYYPGYSWCFDGSYGTPLLLDDGHKLELNNSKSYALCVRAAARNGKDCWSNYVMIKSCGTNGLTIDPTMLNKSGNCFELSGDIIAPQFNGPESIYDASCIKINGESYNCAIEYSIQPCKRIKIEIQGIYKNCPDVNGYHLTNDHCVTFSMCMKNDDPSPCNILAVTTNYHADTDTLERVFETTGIDHEGNCLPNDVFKLFVTITDCAGNYTTRQIMVLYENVRKPVSLKSDFPELRARFCVCASSDCLPILKDCNPILDILIESGLNEYNEQGKFCDLQSAKLHIDNQQSHDYVCDDPSETHKSCLVIGTRVIFRVCPHDVFNDCETGMIHCTPDLMSARLIAQDPLTGNTDDTNRQRADSIELDPLNPGCVLVTFELHKDLANFDNYIFQFSFSPEPEPVFITLIRCICIQKIAPLICKEKDLDFMISRVRNDHEIEFEGTSHQLCIPCIEDKPNVIYIGIDRVLLCNLDLPTLKLYQICDPSEPPIIMSADPILQPDTKWIFPFTNLIIGTYDLEVDIPFITQCLSFINGTPVEQPHTECIKCRIQCNRLILTDVEAVQAMDCLEDICCIRSFQESFCDIYPIATIQLPKVKGTCKYNLQTPQLLNGTIPISLTSANVPLITSVVPLSDPLTWCTVSDYGPNWAYLMNCNNQVRFRLLVDKVPTPNNDPCCEYNLIFLSWNQLIEQYNVITNCWEPMIDCIDFSGDYRLYLICHNVIMEVDECGVQSKHCIESLIPICLPGALEFIRIAPKQHMEMFNVPSEIDCNTHKFKQCPMDWIGFEMDLECDIDSVSDCKTIPRPVTSGYTPLCESKCNELSANEKNVMFVMEGLHCDGSVVAYFRVKGMKGPFKVTAIEWDGDECEDIFKFDEAIFCDQNGQFNENDPIPLKLIYNPFPTKRNQCCTMEIVLTNACCETARYTILVLFIGTLTSVLKICDPSQSVCMIDAKNNETKQSWIGIRDKPAELLFQVNGELLNAMSNLSDPSYDKFQTRPKTPLITIKREFKVSHTNCKELIYDPYVITTYGQTEGISDGIDVTVDSNPSDCLEFSNLVTSGTPVDFADVCFEDKEKILNGGFQYLDNDRKFAETLKFKFDPNSASLCTEQDFCLETLIYKYKFQCRVISFDVLKFLRKIRDFEIFKSAIGNFDPCDIPTNIDICASMSVCREEFNAQGRTENWPIYHFIGGGDVTQKCEVLNSCKPILCEVACDPKPCDNGLRVVLYKSLDIRAVQNFDWREVSEPGFINPDFNKRIFGRTEAQKYLGRVWRLSGGFSSKFFCLDLTELNPMVEMCSQENLYRSDTLCYTTDGPHNVTLIEAYETLIAHCQYIKCGPYEPKLPHVDSSQFKYKMSCDGRIYCNLSDESFSSDINKLPNSGFIRRLCDRPCHHDIFLVTIPTSPLGALQTIFKTGDIPLTSNLKKAPEFYNWENESDIQFDQTFCALNSMEQFSVPLIAKNYTSCAKQCLVPMNRVFEMRNTLFAQHSLIQSHCFPEMIEECESSCRLLNGNGCILNFYGMDFKPNWHNAMFPHHIDARWPCDVNHEQIFGYGHYIGYGTCIDPCIQEGVILCNEGESTFTTTSRPFSLLNLKPSDSILDARCTGTIECQGIKYMDWDYCSVFESNPLSVLCISDPCIPQPIVCSGIIMAVNGYRTNSAFNKETFGISFSFDSIESPCFDGRHVRRTSDIDDYRVAVRGTTAAICTPELSTICDTDAEYGSLTSMVNVGTRINPIVATDKSKEICLFKLCGCECYDLDQVTSLTGLDICGLQKLKLFNPCDVKSRIQSVRFKEIKADGSMCFERLDSALTNVIHSLKLCVPDICYHDFAEYGIIDRRLHNYSEPIPLSAIDVMFVMTTTIVMGVITLNIGACKPGQEDACSVFYKFMIDIKECTATQLTDQFGVNYYLTVDDVMKNVSVNPFTPSNTQVVLHVAFSNIVSNVPMDVWILFEVCEPVLALLLTETLANTNIAKFWTSPSTPVTYPYRAKSINQLPLYDCFCCLPLCLCYQEETETESCFVFNELKVIPEQQGAFSDKRIFANTLHNPFRSQYVPIGLLVSFMGLNLEIQVPATALGDSGYGQVYYIGTYKDQIEVEFSSGSHTIYDIISANDLGSVIDFVLLASENIGSGSPTGFRLLKDIRNLVPGQRLPSEAASRFFSNNVSDASAFTLDCLMDWTSFAEKIKDNDVFFSGKLNVESFLPWQGGIMNNELYNSFTGTETLSVHRALKVHLKDKNSSGNDCGNTHQVSYSDNEKFGSVRKNPAPIGFTNLMFELNLDHIEFNMGELEIPLEACDEAGYFKIKFISKQDEETVVELCATVVDGCLIVSLPTVPESECVATAPTSVTLCPGDTLCFKTFTAMITGWSERECPDRLICKLQNVDCSEMTFQRVFTEAEWNEIKAEIETLSENGQFEFTKENIILQDNLNLQSGRECMDIVVTLNEEFFEDNESSEFSVNDTLDYTENHAQDKLKLIPSGSKSFYFLFQNCYDCMQSIVATRGNSLSIPNYLSPAFRTPNRLGGDVSFVRGDSITKAPQMYLVMITSENDCTVTLLPDCRSTFANSACFRLKTNRPEGGGFPIVTKAKITILLKYKEDDNTSGQCQDDSAAFRKSNKTRYISPRIQRRNEVMKSQKPMIEHTQRITLANGKKKIVKEMIANPLYESTLVLTTDHVLETPVASTLKSRDCKPCGDAPLVNIAIDVGAFVFVPVLDGLVFDYLSMTPPLVPLTHEAQFLKEFMSMSPNDRFVMNDTRGNQNLAVLKSTTSVKPSIADSRGQLLIKLLRICGINVTIAWFLFAVAEGSCSRVQQPYFWNLSQSLHINGLAVERKGSVSLIDICDSVADTTTPSDKEHIYAQVDFNALIQQSSFEKVAHGLLCNIPMIRPQSVDNYLQAPRGICPSGIVTQDDLMQIKVQVEIGGVMVNTNCDEYVYVASGDSDGEKALCIAKRLIDGRHLARPSTCAFSDKWCVRDCSGTVTAIACDTEITGLSFKGQEAVSKRCLRVNIIKEIESDDLQDYLLKLQDGTLLSDFDIDDIARIRSLLHKLILMLEEAGLTLNNAGIATLEPSLLIDHFITLLRYMKNKFGLKIMSV